MGFSPHLVFLIKLVAKFLGLLHEIQTYITMHIIL